MKFFINNKKIQRDRIGKNFDSKGKQPKSFSKNTQNYSSIMLLTWRNFQLHCEASKVFT